MRQSFWSTLNWSQRIKVIAFIVGFFVMPVVFTSVRWFSSISVTLIGLGAVAWWWWAARPIEYQPPARISERETKSNGEVATWDADVVVEKWQPFGKGHLEEPPLG
jgi:hypothetical protein